MLILQRASAGSGKTFTLTKQYLTHLLTIVDRESGRLRLRTEPEIIDAVEHILAVTFTNKATNEMKQRILSRLNALAFPPKDPERQKKVDYLSFFTDTFGASVKEISTLANYALREVLFQYSDFNISTIDAFFQVILRTFAYESDLPDGYNLVIESNTLSQMAVRDLIDDFARHTLEPRLVKWLQAIINKDVQNGTNSWTIFQRKEKGGFSRSLFNDMVEMGETLDKEEYKEVKESIDSFYASGIDLYDSAEKVSKTLADRLAERYAMLVNAAEEVKKVYEDIAGDPNTKLSKSVREKGCEWSNMIYGGSRTAGALNKILSADPDDLTEISPVKAPSAPDKVCAGGVTPSETDRLRASEAVAGLMEVQKGYAEMLESVDFQVWGLIKEGLPRVELMYDIKRRIAAYLEENDAMKLADTNTILHRIIAEDDVPFIYERIGTRINHFLIDEFQDTSRMQWDNFRPLLSESLGKGNENLIIGDAKQSIYRFRSADPTLITHTVTDTFPKSQTDVRGYSEAENTNWRSKRRVVEFNNYFFYSLARHLDEVYDTAAAGESLAELYSNTVQNPHHKQDLGYVRMECVPAPAGDGEEGGGDKISKGLADRIGNLIISLLERGYSQKHIAILANTNQAGAEIIAALMEFNNEHSDRMPRLKFVSDDSLKLSRCQAVRKVVECFRMIQSGIEEDRPAEEEKCKVAEAETGVPQKQVRINWADVGHKFNYYLSQHPGMDLPDALRGFLKDGVGYDLLDEMMAGMQAVTLPSLTEALIEHFVGPEVKSEDAPFLAAFQDAVLDYCESNPADVGSFLKWWDVRGKKLCISSPEGMEAINVMTIHASKGLEFECVIIPEINVSFKMRDTWRWLKVPEECSFHSEVPGYLPVEVKKTTADKSSYEPYIKEYAGQQYMHEVDQLNKVYVAFTRAASELYVYLPPQPGREPNRYLTSMVPEILDWENSDKPMPEIEHLPAPGSITHIQEEDGDPKEWGVFEYGVPIPDVPAMLAKEIKTLDEIDRKETHDLTDYKVYSDKEILRAHPEGKDPYVQPGDEDRADPRSEGTLLHNVLEFVRKEGDLRNAFERLRVRGRISRKFMAVYLPMMEKALSTVRERGWFDGHYRVLAERPIFDRDDVSRRPDRVMVDPTTGECVVVDYKFGEHPTDNSHRKQVGGYVDKLRRTGSFTSVRGYLWYVRENKVEEVEAFA